MIEHTAARLFLLRHAHSAWAEPGGRDHGRALDERGERDAAELGRLLKKRGIVFDRIACSTALRARQTLDALDLAPSPEAIIFSDDLYALGPEAYWQAVRQADACRGLLIVGHNPTIETFALTLTSDEPQPLEGGFPTCGLAIFEVPGRLDACAPGTARFLEAVWP